MMKIIKLRFKNLNSLYGTWTIDFTGADYVDQGLFAITGPTGSGKTTILDAICLALYGATPRLGRLTRSNNEIMSRQTGECFAEVTFQSQAGLFTCHWHQHRAYRRADGVLAEAVHEIADAESGRILETKKRDVLQVIEEKTGMDFVRFTRSILLAQGGFAAFLQATPDERSPILEQLTGTGIYSEISEAVFGRQKAEREIMQQIKIQLAGLPILDEKSHQQLKQQLQDLAEQDEKLQMELTGVQQEVSRIERIRSLLQVQAELAGKEQDLQTRQNAFSPKRLQLSQAQRALEISEVYTAFISYRKQQAEAAENLERLSASHPGLAKHHKSLQDSLAIWDAAKASARKALQDEQPVLRAVRALDVQIEAANRRVALINESLDKQNGQIKQAKKAIKDLVKKLEGQQHQESQVRQYLQQHTADEQLSAFLAVMRAHHAQWQQLERAGCDKNMQLKALREKQAFAQKKLQAKEVDTAKLQSSLNELEHTHSVLTGQLTTLLAGKPLRTWRTERNSLQQILMLQQKIASLEEDRKWLKAGKPCPLCGATEHPYAEGLTPVFDEQEQAIAQLDQLITQAEELSEHLEGIEKKVHQTQTDLAGAARDQQEACHENNTLHDEGLRLEREINQINQEIKVVQDALNDSMLPFGASLAGSLEAVALQLDQLAVRSRHWQQMQQQGIALKLALQTLHAEIEREQAVLQTRQEQYTEQTRERAQHTAQLDLQKKERIMLYGHKQADQEEEQLNRKIADAEDNQQKAYAALEQAAAQLADLQTRILTLQEAVKQRQPLLDQAGERFRQVMQHMGFADEQSYLSARMSEHERQELAGQASVLDQEASDIKIRMHDVTEQLKKEQAEVTAPEQYDALLARRQELQQSRQQAGEQTGAIKQQLADQKAVHRQRMHLQKQLDAQQQVCDRWAQLNDLIGSADGKKFRNFAQGLTFERMVAQANRQLQRMSDRYLLVRDPEKPLELSVMDQYQAGEIRSTKNLSGGESFLVSLALALGLSQMASHKVRVDSLFLDEGFGALDEDALEMALETLTGLQQEGKLIGVISHVGALKERIRTQLNVFPLSGGRSRICGPGVQSDQT